MLLPFGLVSKTFKKAFRNLQYDPDEDITSMDTTSPIRWSWSSTCFHTAGKHLLATVVTASYGF
jgi:hypothetical protein